MEKRRNIIMLNNKKERELAYIIQIDAIEPIEGSDK